MENKKNFFEVLTPKTAAIVGILAGIGLLSFLVCLIFIFIFIQGKMNLNTKTVKNTATAQTQNIQTPEVVKSDKPVVDLFVMSYCPYGLQMQKAVLPVMELFKDKIDFNMRFVSYIMHDKIEIDENNLQYCLQEEQDDKLVDYLKCFTVSGDSKSCLKTAKVNESKLNNCISATDKKFGTTAAYDDKASWLSGYYPLYPVDKELNEMYGVQGSPTMVINGAQAQVSRSPEAVKLAICAAFNNPPKECEETLSTLSASPSFGAGTGTDTAVECGN